MGPLVRHMCRCEHNIKIYFNYIGLESANWINLAQNGVQ
jgi:hypothetical protein